MKQSRSLKILFLSHKFYPDIGGIEVNSEILASAFHKAGHTVRVLTWSRNGNERKFPFEVKRDPGFIDLLKEHAWADIVYENNPCLRLSWPAVFFQKPGVVALRTVVSRADGQINWQDKIKLNRLKRARTVIAVSDAIRKKCWPTATVIPNPYRADVFKFKNDFKRSGNFVFLGRLVSEKGADLAIKAIHQLATTSAKELQSVDPYSLTIIGAGPFRPQLEHLVKELRMQSRVRFTGLLTGSALVSCLNKHKYLLVPSLCEEAFGNVALEGMACGCIPIVSNGGGLPEAVGSAGLVFPKGDLNALATCMRMLLKDEALEKKLRVAAAAHLEAHHPDVISNQYLALIKNAEVTSM
jgi:glycosyltransferase involved in cell wall biosynthesis